MLSGDIILEKPFGAIDGTNRLYVTTYPFVEGSIRVWLNGLLLRPQDEDGWIEVDDSTIETKEAPRATDSVHVRYVQK